MSENFANQLELRGRKSFLTMGILCAIFFAAFGTWSVIAAALNFDDSFPHPIPTAVLAGVFWAAWFILSLYMIAIYYREKLTVTSRSITHQGVLRSRTTAISDIISAKWRTWHKGGIVICYPNSQFKIHFDRFPADKGEQLIALLRELLSEDCQRNWDVFVRSQPLAPTRPEKSRSAAIVCVALFFITAATFATFWYVQLTPWLIVVGVGCGFVGLWYSIRVFKFIPDSESESTA